MPQEGPALCHPGCVGVSLPLLEANASGPKRRLDVKDLERVRTTFLISVCDGASRGGCSPGCRARLSKACSGWACSHLRQTPSFRPQTAPSLCQESQDVAGQSGSGGARCTPGPHPPTLCLLPSTQQASGALRAHPGRGVGWGVAGQPLLLIPSVTHALVPWCLVETHQARELGSPPTLKPTLTAPHHWPSASAHGPGLRASVSMRLPLSRLDSLRTLF